MNEQMGTVLETIGIHEAAHVVVAARLEIVTMGFSFHPYGNNHNHAGAVDSGIPERDDPKSVRDHMVIDLAGLEAERRWEVIDPDLSAHASYDLEHARVRARTILGLLAEGAEVENLVERCRVDAARLVQESYPEILLLGRDFADLMSRVVRLQRAEWWALERGSVDSI